MPTGGGKSLCFELPALLVPGLTVVVSPLIALMEDRVRQLKAKKIAADSLHSQQSKSQRLSVCSRLHKLKLIYVAPETLLSGSVWQKLLDPDLVIANIIIDEAHCIEEWGTTFRPTYTRLGTVRDALQKLQDSIITVAAFTATADIATQQSIVRSLSLRQPQKYILNPYRDNIRLQLRRVFTIRGRKQAALSFLRSKRSHYGLIYVATRKDSETLATWLQKQGFKTAAYHAGVPNTRKRQLEQQWLTGAIPFVVCTSAFGMGIDKPDVRWVLHYHLPQLLAQYLQEIGRSGRDGKSAIALGLVSEPTGWLDNTDKQRELFFTRQIQQKYSSAQKLLTQLPKEGNIRFITQEIPDSELALAILSRYGSVQWLDPFNYRKTSKSNNEISSVISSSQRISSFNRTKQCRWAYILAAYNFPLPKPDFRCGKCDNCLRNVS